jgi:ATP adenylyltransferase
MSASSEGEPPQSHDTTRLVPVADHQRLWTPWRMRYVAGGAHEDGCIFCNRLQEDDDARTLILHRGDRTFVIMNLYPYNTGHVMIVPREHVATPETSDPVAMAEMAALRGPVLRALRRALSCDGFNLGLNVGAVAGAGVTEHLHEHVVPRWLGDANFMPILASTMVMPELIPVTYAKLRSEIERELGGEASVTSLVIEPGSRSILVEESGNLPQITAAANEPLWRAALRDARERGVGDVELIGWGGETRAGAAAAALVLRASSSADTELAPGNRFAPFGAVLSGAQVALLQAALRRQGADG